MLLHQGAGGGAHRPRQVVQEVLGAGVGDFGVGLAPGDPVVVSNVCQDGLTGLDVCVAKEEEGLLSVAHFSGAVRAVPAYPRIVAHGVTGCNL